MTEIGDFLRSRRARIRPKELGLPEGVRRRRVPGLRREELAQLAGVSMGYYTRLEQGAADGASDSVLDAIARVLRLDATETAHLHRLARPASRRRPRPPEVLRPSIAQTVAAIHDVPVLVLGRRLDVLAWNRLCQRVIAPNVPFDALPFNVLRMIFLDPTTRDVYADWQGKARDNVAFLRVAAAKYPDDTELAALIDELRARAPEFTPMWNAHPIDLCTTATRVYRVPGAGELVLTSEMLTLPDDEGQTLAIYHPTPGTATEEALRGLATDVGVGRAG